MTTYHHQIEEAEQEVLSLKRQYLQRWGWQETCNTPGAYWLWRRDFVDLDKKRQAWEEKHDAGKPGRPSKMPNYGVVTTPMDLAISMTASRLDEQLELADEETA